MLIIDYKSAPSPDPDGRFATYRPQRDADADAEMVRARWPEKPLNGVAIHWTSEGTLTLAESLIEETV